MNETDDKPVRHLGKHLLGLILLASTVCTAIFTSISFWLDYRTEVNLLDLTYRQSSENSIPGIEKSLYELDFENLKSQARGILKINDFIRVVIFDETGKTIFNLAKPEIDYDEHLLTEKTWPLHFTHRQKKSHIGSLQIYATKHFMFDRLKQKALYFFFSQGLNTLIVSLVILAIVRMLVIRNLIRMSNFVRTITPGEIRTLRLPGNRSKPNELDILCTTINQMSQSLHNSFGQIEREIEKQKQLTINSARLASLGEMAGGVAHEINNPLAIIDGNNQMMRNLARRGRLETDFVLKSTASIERTVARISSIVKGLLYFSKDANDEPWQEVPVGEVLQDVINLWREKMLVKNIEFVVPINLQNHAEKLRCNRIQISQVIVNLLNNAVDATSTLKERWVRLGLEIKPDQVEISVTDSGAGINPEIAPKIMNPFFTTKPFGSGTGLGLSMSVGIVEAHHGTLFHDEQDAHTRFVVSLPLAEPALPQAG